MLLVLLGSACTPTTTTSSLPIPTVVDDGLDSDGDGLSDQREAARGTDPAVPDTDGDGLLDGEEVRYRTDPLDPDTDDDSYGDRDEISEGKNPLDPDDVIYTGGWPFFYEKSQVSESKGGLFMIDGNRFRRLLAYDQHDDLVDLFDFYNRDGEFVVLQLATRWDDTSTQISDWVRGDLDLFEDGRHDAVRDWVADGSLRWITILVEDDNGRPASQPDAEAWAQAHPNPNVAVFADSAEQYSDYIGNPTVPQLILLRPEMFVEYYNFSDWAAPLAQLEELY